jgi:glutamate N-acetyltransferase/amino-acid N-acetyltransferase
MKKDFRIIVDLHKGGYEDFAIGCDLSYEYVKINSEYTT